MVRSRPDRDGEAAPPIADGRSCVGCGLRLPPTDDAVPDYVEASPACWGTYMAILEREYGDPAYMVVHRLTVDAYCVQHPVAPDPRAIQSLNAHLVGLHMMIDRGATGAFTRSVLNQVTSSLRDRLTWLPPPDRSDALTVGDVIVASDARDHGVRVGAWAASVWASWQRHHAAIAALATDAIARL